MVRFYSSYILTSLDPRYVNHTYIGFTNHPKRRIRQHNGLIKNGARMTKFKRPWEMVLLVHGFTSKRQALHFEAVWQKPQNCVRMREVLKRLQFRSGLSLRVKIRYLFEMLQLDPWKNLPLTVQWLNDKYWNEDKKPTKWKTPITQNCPLPPLHIKMMVAPLESLEVYNKNSDQSDNEDDENSSDQSYSLLSDSNLNDNFTKDPSLLTQSLEPCSICDQDIFYHQETACCPHFSCSAKTHLQCLSSWFLKDSPNLLPTYGFCPVCSAPHSWSDAINTKTSTTTTPTKQPKNNTTYSTSHSHSTLSANSTHRNNNNNATLLSPNFSCTTTTTTHSNHHSSPSQKGNKKREPLSPILINSNHNNINNTNNNNNNNCIETTPPQKRTKNNSSPSFFDPPQNTTTPQKLPTVPFPFILSNHTNNMHTPNAKETRFRVKDVGNRETILIDDENENESDNDDFLQSGLFD